MSAQPRTSLVDGDYVMTAEDFRRIAAMLHSDSGIVMNGSKATLVYSRLAKRLRSLGLESFRDYCALVAGGEGGDERQHMLSALTTNLTRFFREPHHFDDLRTRVLPRLVERARRGERVRVWSAGCSNGAEPYSIGMTILDALPDAPSRDVRVLATDIDFRMVQAARDGDYDAGQAQGLEVQAAGRWMRARPPAEGAGWRAGEELRALVAFRELNLLDAWPMQGRFDAIFCRNVCIYFDEPTQEGLWSRFADRLAPGGTLYIGHSERVAGEAQARLRNDGVTTYRLAEGAR